MLKTLVVIASLLISKEAGACNVDAPSCAEGVAEITANQKAMDNMRKNMMVMDTGNADNDFVSHMLPHHQGAVDMAKVELQYGKDPELRKLAQNVITSQQGEIRQMQDWQAKQNKAAK